MLTKKDETNQPTLFSFYQVYDEGVSNVGISKGTSRETTELRGDKTQRSIQSSSIRDFGLTNPRDETSSLRNEYSTSLGTELSKDNQSPRSTRTHNTSVTTGREGTRNSSGMEYGGLFDYGDSQLLDRGRVGELSNKGWNDGSTQSPTLSSNTQASIEQPNASDTASEGRGNAMDRGESRDDRTLLERENAITKNKNERADRGGAQGNSRDSATNAEARSDESSASIQGLPSIGGELSGSLANIQQNESPIRNLQSDDRGDDREQEYNDNERSLRADSRISQEGQNNEDVSLSILESASQKNNEPTLIAEYQSRVFFDDNDNRNFKADTEVFIGSIKERFNKNIAAINLLYTLESQNALPNEEQCHILNAYSGWGGIPQAFDENNEKWQEQYQILKNLLNTKEYKEAKRSTLDAFYTPKIVVDSIYKGLNHFGFNNDDNPKDIFEPSVGIGTFISYANNDKYFFNATELDGISARIAQKLYPDAKIHHIGFEKYKFSRQYDAFIGNVPFGQKGIYDEDKDLNNLSVHNYFIANSIKNLKEYGIGAFVVSSYFLDSKENKHRELIAKDATFLGAIRLPNKTFKDRANTEVMSDIVFFKKGADSNTDKSWIEVEEVENGVYCNKYFLARENRDKVIGQLKIATNQFGRASIECDGQNIDNMKEKLQQAIESLPKDVYKYQETIYQHQFFLLNPEAERYKSLVEYLQDKKEGNFITIDDEIFSIVAKEPDFKLKILEIAKTDKERIKSFIQLRDTFNELIKLEKSDIDDTDINLSIQRDRLNSIYNTHIKKYGFLNAQGNKILKGDIESNKIIALEKNYTKPISKETALKNGVEPRKASAEKSDIFKRRTIRPAKDFVIETPKQALIASLSLYGEIRQDFIMQSLPQMKKNDVIDDLKTQGLVFSNHTDKNEIVLAESYLSGNVKKRYKEVKALVDSGDYSLEYNLKALESVLPQDIKAMDISATFGTTWIPQKYYKEFVVHILNCPQESVLISHSRIDGWFISVNNESEEARHKYSFRGYTTEDIINHAISRQYVKVEKIVGYDEKDRPIKELDVEATTIVNEKIESVRHAFDDWIYQDHDRRIDLENIYNDTFNTNADKVYDGSHLKLRDFNSNITLMPHQKNAIWRCIQEQNILLDHQVGAGKTFVTICALMEQKKMGLIEKPLVIVPNHIIEQWKDSFYSAYPNANILVANKTDFTKDKREQFFAKVGANNWDCVIMTHSQFKELPTPKEHYEKFMDNEIEEYEYFLDTLRYDKDNRYDTRYIKRLEAQKSNLVKKLAEDREKQSKAIDFSELGIDCVVVDEAHEFKNLGVRTKMKGVLGLGAGEPAQKAQNLYAMTQYLHDSNKKIMFLTGTPISNSIVELYTMQRYLQPNTLKEKGISDFDSWACAFGETTTDFELDSSGVVPKLVTRFSKFKNVGELVTMYREIADVISNEDILKVNPSFVPKLYNDKPINVVCPRSDDVAYFIGVQDENMQWNEGSVVWRMENFNRDPRYNNVLACTTDARKAGLDFRLIDPTADDYKESKANALCQNIYKEWQEWTHEKGTQLVFCDLSTPKIHSQKVRENLTAEEINSIATQEKEEFRNLNDILENSKDIEADEKSREKSPDEQEATQSKFDVYSDVLKKLVKLGIPQNEIAFIHDAKTDLQKQKLFDDVNAGRIRVLLGSRSKMGAGTNVQKRITAVHHLDCPWRPSDLLQSNGRAIRQGNELFAKYGDSFRIKEFRYATSQTYDARQWQVIETKSRSVEQFRSADRCVREFEDISMGSVDAAEMKAEATGNPLMLLQVQLSKELKTESIKESAFKREFFMNEENLKRNMDYKPILEQELQTLKGLKGILDTNKPSINFICQAFNGEALERFEIIKDNDKSQNNQKRLEEIFWKTFDNALASKEETLFFEYRGLNITGLASEDARSFNFIINDNNSSYIEPENLAYQIKPNDLLANDFHKVISFNGFWSRLNNFCNKLDTTIEEKKQTIDKNAELIRILSKQVANNIYPRTEYLRALEKDNKNIIMEIRKMSKQKDYKSHFEPQSPKILAQINATHRKQAQLEA